MSVTIREQTHQRTCPFGQFSIICRTVTTKRTSTKLTVCILSPHPLVLSEFERILAKSQFKVVLKQLESTLAPDLRALEPPRAQVTSLTLMLQSPPPERSWPIFSNAIRRPAS